MSHLRVKLLAPDEGLAYTAIIDFIGKRTEPDIIQWGDRLFRRITPDRYANPTYKEAEVWKIQTQQIMRSR